MINPGVKLASPLQAPYATGDSVTAHPRGLFPPLSALKEANLQSPAAQALHELAQTIPVIGHFVW